MDGKWRNLILIVAVIVAAFFIYSLFLSGEKSFESQFSGLKGYFQEKGATTNSRIDLSRINSLSDNDLISLKSSITKFKDGISADGSRSSNALLLAAEIYYSYIETVGLGRKSENQAKITDIKNVCSSISNFESAKGTLQELIRKRSAFETAAGEFVKGYAAENEIAGLEFTPPTQQEKDAAAKSFSDFSNYLSELKAGCGASLSAKELEPEFEKNTAYFIAPVVVTILYWVLGATAVGGTGIGYAVWNPTGGTVVVDLANAMGPPYVIEHNDGLVFDCDESTDAYNRNLWIANSGSLNWLDGTIDDKLLNVRCEGYDKSRLFGLKGGSWAKYTVGGKLVEECNYAPRSFTVNYGQDYSVDFEGCVKFTFKGPDAESWVSGDDDTHIDGFVVEINEGVMKALKLGALFKVSSGNALRAKGEQALAEELAKLHDDKVIGDYLVNIDESTLKKLNELTGWEDEQKIYEFLSKEEPGQLDAEGYTKATLKRFFVIDVASANYDPKAEVEKDSQGKYHFKIIGISPGDKKIGFKFKDKDGKAVIKVIDEKVDRAMLINVIKKPGAI